MGYLKSNSTHEIRVPQVLEKTCLADSKGSINVNYFDRD